VDCRGRPDRASRRSYCSSLEEVTPCTCYAISVMPCTWPSPCSGKFFGPDPGILHLGRRAGCGLEAPKSRKSSATTGQRPSPSPAAWAQRLPRAPTRQSPSPGRSSARERSATPKSLVGKSHASSTTDRFEGQEATTSIECIDKLFWVRKFWVGWKNPLIIVTPETVVRWH
jgi:hypothetical protein